MSEASREPLPRLPPEVWAEVTRHSPLVSMDLVVRDASERMLVGLRTNAPAQGFWFVPGGALRKNETLALAFRRICEDELGEPHELEASSLLGVHEHFYDTNFTGDASFGTHYVVVVRELHLAERPSSLPREQHDAYRWLSDEELVADARVHPFVKRYVKAVPVTEAGPCVSSGDTPSNR